MEHPGCAVPAAQLRPDYHRLSQAQRERMEKMKESEMKFLFLIPVLTTLCLISAAAELAPLRVKDGKVMAGDRDLIRRSHTEAIHHLIPGSRLAILRGPHDLMRKNPVAFNRTVLAFLREESLRAAERTPDRSPKTDCAEG